MSEFESVASQMVPGAVGELVKFEPFHQLPFLLTYKS